LMLAALFPGRGNLALFTEKSHALDVCFYLDNLTIVA